MIKIQPVEIPTKGTAKYLEVRCLQIGINKLSQASPTFYWAVKKATPYAIDEVQTEIPGETLLEGNLNMTNEEYAERAADDSYVVDWALAKLGFEEDTTENLEG